MTVRVRGLALVLSVAWLVNQARWARRTRPEPLPAPPAGSTSVQLSDGCRLHAQVGGVLDARTTLVFVHGFLARTLGFDMQWHSFAHRARTVRYDHRNHGRSDHGGGALEIQTLADDLAQVLEQLAPEGEIVLVGHSMGGMTILALADSRPELFTQRVRAVALLATGAGHYIDDHRWENGFRWGSRRGLLAPGLLALRFLAPALEQLRPRRTHLMRWATRHVAFGTTDIDPATLTMTQALLEEPPLSTLASLQGSLLRHDAVRGLLVLRLSPVLVMTGSEDKLTRPEHSVRLAQDLGPQAKLVIVTGAGHVLHQTRAAEVNAALNALLDRSALA